MPRPKTALVRVSVTLSMIVVGLVLLLPAAGSAEVDVDQWDRYVVQVDDTLWGIAVGLTSPSEDVRETVNKIREANRLASSVIFSGQTLHIPPGVTSPLSG